MGLEKNNNLYCGFWAKCVDTSGAMRPGARTQPIT